MMMGLMMKNTTMMGLMTKNTMTRDTMKNTSGFRYLLSL